jgi:hypothetical protein
MRLPHCSRCVTGSPPSCHGGTFSSCLSGKLMSRGLAPSWPGGWLFRPGHCLSQRVLGKRWCDGLKHCDGLKTTAATMDGKCCNGLQRGASLPQCCWLFCVLWLISADSGQTTLFTDARHMILSPTQGAISWYCYTRYSVENYHTVWEYYHTGSYWILQCVVIYNHTVRISSTIGTIPITPMVTYSWRHFSYCHLLSVPFLEIVTQ